MGKSTRLLCPYAFIYEQAPPLPPSSPHTPPPPTRGGPPSVYQSNPEAHLPLLPLSN